MGRPQTPREEVVNTATHGMGVALAIAGLAVLLVHAARTGDPWRIVAASVYGTSMVLLYLASTLYHAVRDPDAKHVLHILDHSAIFLLIAGTYTPFTLVTLRGAWGWTMFGVIWGLAVAGIVFKVFFTGRFKYASVAVWIAMGWLMVVAARPLLSSLDAGGMALLLAGGLSYTVGVVFYAVQRIPFHHGIWHLFVLGGSIPHFFAVLGYVI